MLLLLASRHEFLASVIYARHMQAILSTSDETSPYRNEGPRELPPRTSQTRPSSSTYSFAFVERFHSTDTESLFGAGFARSSLTDRGKFTRGGRERSRETRARYPITWRTIFRRLCPLDISSSRYSPASPGFPETRPPLLYPSLIPTSVTCARSC